MRKVFLTNLVVLFTALNISAVRAAPREEWKEYKLENAGIFYLPSDWNVIEQDGTAYSQKLPQGERGAVLFQRSLCAQAQIKDTLVIDLITFWTTDPVTPPPPSNQMKPTCEMLHVMFFKEKYPNTKLNFVTEQTLIKSKFDVITLTENIANVSAFTYDVTNEYDSVETRVKYVPVIHKNKISVLCLAYIPSFEIKASEFASNSLQKWHIDADVFDSPSSPSYSERFLKRGNLLAYGIAGMIIVAFSIFLYIPTKKTPR